MPLPCAWLMLLLTHALFKAIITGPFVSSERADFIKIQ